MMEAQQRQQLKKRFLGLASVCVVLASIVFLGAVVGWGYLRHRSGQLDETGLTLIVAAVVLSAITAGVALALAALALIRQQQKKGVALAGLILSMAILLGCVGTIFAYHYSFSAILHTIAYNDVSRLDREGAGAGDAGLVVRERPVLDGTLTASVLAALDPEGEATFEALSYDALPVEAKVYFPGVTPTGQSYCLGRYEEITTYLLLCLDAAGETENICLLSVDPVHEKLKLLALPADAWLPNTAVGAEARLASASLWSGGEGTMQVVEENFQLPLAGYIAVEETALETVLDGLGTVEVVLSSTEAGQLSRLGQVTSAGRSALDGGAAACFVAAWEDDTTRLLRQETLLKAVRLRLRKLPLDQYPGFATLLAENVASSLSEEELLLLCMTLSQQNYAVEAASLEDALPFWRGTLGEKGYSYCIFDAGRASDWLYRQIYEDFYFSGYEK